MSGSVTAAAGQNFIAPNPPSQQPSPSPAATPNDQFAAANNGARGQVNAWGWPSGFNQPSPASNNAAGPSRPPSFSTAPVASPALVSATMFTPQAQQINHQQHQHQQQPQQPQLQLQHPHQQQQHQQQQHQQHPQHPGQPQHLQQQQHHLGGQQQQQHNPHLQLQQQQQQAAQQQQQQGQQPPQPNSAKATVYPPQPYGNPPAFTAPSHTSSPNSAAKPNTPNNHSVMMSKKRTASKSPDFEGKDKRSRPEDGVSGDNKGADSHTGSISDGRVWGEEATKLDVYVWDYLSRRGFNSAAKALMNEAGMTEPPEVPLKTPQGLLFEYWAIFWDVFAARSGRGGSEAAAYFEYLESRNMQRLAEASRKTEALEAQYQAPENGGRFPNIVVSGLNADPNAAGAGATSAGPNGVRAAAPGAWNPAALPQAQQQQLLITAAQRQNIPLHEIKNLTPASRMALINSMNPNNPANAQAVRPGMNNALMEQQLQARLQQQQALHRMMQQQRQAGGQGPMPNHASVPGAPPMTNAMQVRPPMGPQQMPGAGGSPAPPTPGGTIDGRRSVGPGAEGNRPDHMGGPPGVLAAGNPQSQSLQPPTPGGPQPQPQQQQQQPGGPPQPGQPGQQQHPQLNPHQQQMVMNQFQSVQAAMREEWMKAQNAPNQTTAADFYANVQAYQAKAQGLQNLLRAQANYQGGAGAGAPGNGAQPGGMPGQPGPSPQQARPPQMGGGAGMPGGPTGVGSPASMANMTPQQRAAQIANAQAAAGRITPLMATHDPGLMASMMGPNSMPNGTGARPNNPPHQQGGPSGQQQQQPGQQQGGPPGQQGGFQQPPQPQQQQNQPQGPPRPPSAQGGPEDPHTSHFSSVQMGSSPASMQRPGMQRGASQLGNSNAAMGPPGAASISSPSPRITATNLQQSQSQGSNATPNQPQQSQGESPAPSNVPNTPKLGSAEKGKKGNARQRKNSKATTKTPVLSAASIPGSTAPAAASSNGAAGPSTPAAATPVSTSAATPGRDAAVSKPNDTSSGPPGPMSQPIDAAMPPPANPADSSNAFGGVGGENSGINGTDGNNNGGNGAADGNGAGGGSAEDFSMFGFGGSMNDIFDFDLSTDGAGGGGMGGDWGDGNFGGLFGSGAGGQDGS